MEKSNTLARLTEKLNEKGATSGLFKHTKRPSDAFDALVKKMQSITDEIKILEEKLKGFEVQPKSSNPPTAETIKPSIVYQNKHQSFTNKFSIRTLPKQDHARWTDFLSNRAASVYQTTVWQEVIKKSFGHDTLILIAEDEKGEILAGLPITILSSFLFGRMGVSIPYVNYGGVETEYLNVTKALLSHCESLALEHKLKHVEVRTTQAGLATDSVSKKASMILALPHTDSELESQLSAKVRAQYKKAETNEPTIKFGKLDVLDDFYAVFSKNMRDLGTPVYSKSFFKNILDTPNIDATIAVGYLQNQPVSTGFLIRNNDMLEIPWASTLREVNSKNMNMWTYRKMLSYAIEHKYEYFDFGRSTIDAGTYKFKKQWGTQAFEHHWYYFGRGASNSDLNTENPKLQLLIKIWRRLPLWVTKIIGPHIIRGIP